MQSKIPKTFKDYNAYHDRGMMKWGTAYAMEELVSGIKKNQAEALKDLKLEPSMTRDEIDDVLQEAFLQVLPITVQLNTRDEMGRVKESLVGFFDGRSTSERWYFAGQWLLWEDVRNVRLVSPEKWFKVD